MTAPEPETAVDPPAARRSPWWLAVVASVVVLGFAVPYTVLRGVDAWYGAALFWTLCAVVVIGVNVVVSAAWRD